jgi:thiol-disulfide isomerase/thioredoxin
MNKNTITSGLILLSVVLFNAGCIQNLFSINAEKKQPTIISQNTTQPKKRYREYKNPDVECNDDLTVKKSNCDKGTISETELKHRPKNGDTHVLKSIRGKVIHIIERPNGFLFPEYNNKIIILEMFGKDCPHCLRELPIIDKIRRRYRGRLEVIAIQSQGRMTRFRARAYINGHRIRYPIIEGDDATNLQYFIQKTYGWTGILPYTLIVKDGITEFVYSGEVDYKDIKRDIDSLFLTHSSQ